MMDCTGENGSSVFDSGRSGPSLITFVAQISQNACASLDRLVAEIDDG